MSGFRLALFYNKNNRQIITAQAFYLKLLCLYFDINIHHGFETVWSRVFFLVFMLFFLSF